VRPFCVFELQCLVVFQAEKVALEECSTIPQKVKNVFKNDKIHTFLMGINSLSKKYEKSCETLLKVVN